jgi:hypothetical protein
LGKFANDSSRFDRGVLAPARNNNNISGGTSGGADQDLPFYPKLITNNLIHGLFYRTFCIRWQTPLSKELDVVGWHVNK